MSEGMAIFMACVVVVFACVGVYVVVVTIVKAFANAIDERYTLRNDIAALKKKVTWLLDRNRLTDDRIETLNALRGVDSKSIEEQKAEFEKIDERLARLLKGDSQYKGEAMTCYRCGKELGYRIECPTDEGVLAFCEDFDGCNDRMLAGRRVTTSTGVKDGDMSEVGISE